MANLNLSEFTEKLFVADADHTFIWDTAASISKRVSRNSWLNSGTLTSDAPVTISQTWNNAAVAFTGLKVDATNTNSAAASKLLDLQVGGASLANFSKAGHLIFPSSSTVTPSGPGVGQWVGTLALFGTGGSLLVTGSSSALNISGNVLLSWNNDTILLRDGAANTLALRNGTAAQTFNVYGTYTSGTSYERLTLSAPSAANAIIGTNKGSGGGTAQGLDLHTDGAARMTISTAGNVGIGTTAPGTKLEVAGTFYFGSNNGALPGYASYGGNIGASRYFFITGTSVDNTTIYLQNNSSGSKNAMVRLLGSGSGADYGALQMLTIESSPVIFATNATEEKMRITSAGNVGIGTTSPTSKLHVAGSSSPGIAIENGVATGYSELLFKNTVVTGSSIFLNGSAQSGYGGNNSLNIYSSNGPLAFHTASVTNALSIAQSGAATFSSSLSVGSWVDCTELRVDGSEVFNTSGATLLVGTGGFSGLNLGAGNVIIRIGGTTNLFPALKRSATTIQARLANDSDFAPIQGKLTTETAFTATTVTPTGFITLYDSTGTAYKVPCVPA